MANEISMIDYPEYGEDWVKHQAAMKANNVIMCGPKCKYTTPQAAVDAAVAAGASTVNVWAILKYPGAINDVTLPLPAGILIVDMIGSKHSDFEPVGNRAFTLTNNAGEGWTSYNDGVDRLGYAGSVKFRARVGFRNLRVAFGNFSNKGDVNPAKINEISIMATVSHDNANWRIPLTFNKQRSVTILPGEIVYTDPLNMDFLPGSESTDHQLVCSYWVSVDTVGKHIPSCDPSYLNTGALSGVWATESPSAKTLIQNCVEGVSNNNGSRFGLPDNTTINAEGVSNRLTNPAQNASVIKGCYTPLGFFGEPIYKSKPSVALVVDSVANADSSDYPRDSTNTNIVRALYTAGIPYIMLGSDGERLESMMDRFTHAQKAMLKTCDYAIVGLGYNDISGNTVATIKMRMQAMWQYAVDQGCKVLQCTIIPGATATDNNFRSFSTQTVFGSGWSDARIEINDWLTSRGSGTELLSGVIDIASAVEGTGENRGKWKWSSATPDTGSAYVYTDGVHPSAAGNQAMQSVINAALVDFVI